MSAGADGDLYNADWRKVHPEKAARLYPAGLAAAAKVAAETHEHAIQYLEQAPAVIAFVTHGGCPSRGADLQYLARSFGSAAHRRPRLRDLLAAFGAPLPIRRISAQACFADVLPAIYDLRSIPPSTLAQAIPEKVGQQRSWLAALMFVREARRGLPLREQWGDDLWRWAVPALGRAAPAYPINRRGTADRPSLRDATRDVLDFLRREGPVNPVWSFAQALAATEAWHGRLARQRTEQSMLQTLGFAFDYRFPYGPVPDQREIGGFAFHALRSGEELFEEGQAMRHCVATYIRQVADGVSYIVGIRQGDRRVATLELAIGPKERLRAVQLKGRCNAAVTSAEVLAAVSKFVTELNEAQEAARGSAFHRMLDGLLGGRNAPEASRGAD